MAALEEEESLWIVVWSYSSTKAKEEARRKWTCEKAERLVVLEARVKQLQADNACEVAAHKAQEARSGKSDFSQAALVQKEPAPKHEDGCASHCSHWMEKLNREKSIKYKQLLRLEAKLSVASPRTIHFRKGGKAAQGKENPWKQLTDRCPNSPAKFQAPKETRGLLWFFSRGRGAGFNFRGCWEEAAATGRERRELAWECPTQ